MLHKPIVHEFNNNSVYLRSKEMEIHMKKLNQIKKRKNKFNLSTGAGGLNLLGTTDNELFKNKLKAKNSPSKGFKIVQNYFIDRDNRYLCDKLYAISSRENNYVVINIKINFF